MPTITQHDFLNPLFSLHPLVVALVILLTGWGSLFLIAWKTKTINTVLLGHPSFLIGDFLLLPLAGFLITYFYQSISNPSALVTTTNWNYLSVIFAIAITIVLATYSVITKSYNGVWSIPHTIFILFFVYILSNFLIRGLLTILPMPTLSLGLIYVAVVLVILAHIVIKLTKVFGPATFPAS